MHDYLNEHQKDAVEALQCLQKICDEAGIRFYLLAGSTLGAVRHEGMIPWDDDVDVGLLYEDWYKLREVLEDKISNTKFTYIDDEIDKTYPRLFGKILYKGQGCVDLFLIAKWTQKSLAGKIHWQIRRTAVIFYQYSIRYKLIRGVRYMRLPLLKKMKYFIVKFLRYSLYLIISLFFKRDDYIKLARWNEKYYEGKETGWYINLYSVYSMEKEMIKAEWIYNPSYVKFEGNKYLTVGDTDTYLTHLYGDYMTPPPQSERLEIHKGELFGDK